MCVCVWTQTDACDRVHPVLLQNEYSPVHPEFRNCRFDDPELPPSSKYKWNYLHHGKLRWQWKKQPWMKMYLLLKIGDFPAIFVLGVVFHPSQVGLPSLLRYICQDAKALDVQRSHPGDIRRYQVSQVMPLSPQGYLVVPLVTPQKICFWEAIQKEPCKKSMKLTWLMRKKVVSV